MLYHVEVKQQGIPVADYRVEASDALAAINLVERDYSGPIKVEIDSTEDEQSHKHQAMVVGNWHGYMFDARAIRP